MKCEQCASEGKRSKVYEGCGYVTCLGWAPFYDEDGVYHSHDPNATSLELSCSNGHSWNKTIRSRCPAADCEWNSKP